MNRPVFTSTVPSISVSPRANSAAAGIATVVVVWTPPGAPGIPPPIGAIDDCIFSADPERSMTANRSFCVAGCANNGAAENASENRTRADFIIRVFSRAVKVMA